MKTKEELSGWNLIIYQLLESKFFTRQFSLSDVYKYEKEFKKVYPSNFHIKDKIRQTLQNLRNYDLLTFLDKGVYHLNIEQSKKEYKIAEHNPEYVYLLSNESMPNWVKIGRTIDLNERIKTLYNTAVPLPFKLEDAVEVNSFNDSRLLEKSIHNIIDTINPALRKDTEANRREFFKMSVDEAKKVFSLVRLINRVEINH